MDSWARFWRTASGYEVDFVLGDMAVAIEVKAGKRVHDGDLAGLRALGEERKVKRRILIAQEPEPRVLDDGIEIWPWQHFLQAIWAGALDV